MGIELKGDKTMIGNMKHRGYWTKAQEAFDAAKACADADVEGGFEAAMAELRMRLDQLQYGKKSAVKIRDTLGNPKDDSSYGGGESSLD